MIQYPLPFNPDTTRWDPANALFLATCSDIAYKADNPALASDLATKQLAGVVSCTVFTSTVQRGNTHTAGVVIALPRAVIVAFRGTVPSDLTNWMTDFAIAPIPFEYIFEGAPSGIGFVHNGFAHALDDVWPGIIKIVDNMPVSNPPVARSLWFCGHSLGAALATLAAAGCLFDGRYRRPVNGVYTFGSPRVGNHFFVSNYDARLKERTYRFVHNADIVTRIPPRVLDYVAVGRLVYIDKSGHLSNDEGWWTRFLAEVQVGLSVAQNFPSVVQDHDLATGYINPVNSYLTGGSKPALSWG